MVERDDDPDAPPSAEEVAASQRLRDALEDDRVRDPDADLARALHAAYAPEPIGDEEHAAILRDVPTADELRAAEGVLDDPLVAALRAAWSPKDLPAEEHRAIVARALASNVVSIRRRVSIVRIAFSGSALALAAGIVLWLSTPPKEAPMARSRSTQPLFTEPFRAGETSARIDKIAVARASDYRDNRFAKWGLR